MKLPERFKKIKLDKFLAIAFGALGIAILLICLLPSSDPNERQASADPVNVDTLIPSGYMLIPIELSNAESLSSLAGSYGVVDLFTANPEKNKKSTHLLRKVKLLRAPLNPQQFAVLVREDQGGLLLSHEGPYFAALKNPKESPEAIVAAKPKLVISYGD